MAIFHLDAKLLSQTKFLMSQGHRFAAHKCTCCSTAVGNHCLRPTILGIFKKNSIKCKCYLTDKKIYTYGSEEPLKLAGVFRAEVSFNNKVIDNVDFLVLKGER